MALQSLGRVEQIGSDRKRTRVNPRGRRAELFPIGCDADSALRQSLSHFFGSLRFDEHGPDLRMGLAEAAFKFNNCRLDVGRAKSIVEFEAEADDDLIRGELDGDNS